MSRSRYDELGGSARQPFPTDSARIRSIDPTTGDLLAAFVPLSDVELEEKLELAARTFQVYRKSQFSDRKRWTERAAEILEADSDELGRLITAEMGKPLRASIDEVKKCASGCRYYAENAERLLADEAVETDATTSYVRYQPMGPVLAVMPWNFPFWQVFRFAAPALMAGNVGLLKHASNVPQSALAIERVLSDAGFPPGAFQTLLIGSDRVERVLEDPRVKAATLTGSEPAGSAVAAIAGKHIKKTVLELGGSDPFIVMPSADLDEAITTAIRARIVNNGQSCIAAKRFIVADPVAAEFERRFVSGMEALEVGDPSDPRTQVGPLATADILDALDDQVQRTLRAGARLLTGGKRLERSGNFYSPTVLADVPINSPAYREELFGPVAALFRVRDVDAAIQLANDTSFGLGASAWTNQAVERARLIDEIEAGLVFVNGMVASDPRLPFGGAKRSGYGRELAQFGIREFVNVKTVWIRDSTR
jgi:succinate-semialdehyde dehydrogenase/glutarate-semialdehyde dehydrogenase